MDGHEIETKMKDAEGKEWKRVISLHSDSYLVHMLNKCSLTACSIPEARNRRSKGHRPC